MKLLKIALLAALLLIISASPAAGQTSYMFQGLDAHDGTIVQVGSTYYLYGTRHGCGFVWLNASTPWCGFGAWTSTDLANWTFQGLLFNQNGTNPWRNESWQATCMYQGDGCFNPRMVQRSDGVWILWFNAPGDFARSAANAYYVMGCNGPAGPCGADAGAPHGSTAKPSMWFCSENGDFSIFVDGTTAYMFCTFNNQTLGIEQLDQWWANGNQTLGERNVASLTSTESPGVFKDTANSTYLLTYSDPNCGFCGGTGTGWGWSTSVLGTWSVQDDAGGGTAPASGRRDLSATSCGGQPRTIVTLGGQPYEWIDLWVGTRSDTSAGVHLEPLRLNPPYAQAPLNGAPLVAGILPFTC